MEYGLEADDLRADMKLADLGDSLDAVELRMSLEEEFGIEIPEDDAEKITTVGQVLAYMDRHTQA